MFGWRKECPRCGFRTVEYLNSYSHCWECNYFPEDQHELSEWHKLEYQPIQNASKIRTFGALAACGHGGVF